jgi:hypothetical protein
MLPGRSAARGAAVELWAGLPASDYPTAPAWPESRVHWRSARVFVDG